MGFEMANVAEYSTMPRALRGASWISVMMALRGSFGSSSPAARPLSDFVLAGLTERLAFEGGRFAVFDDDAGDAGFEGRCGEDREGDGDEAYTADHMAAIICRNGGSYAGRVLSALVAVQAMTMALTIIPDVFYLNRSPLRKRGVVRYNAGAGFELLFENRDHLPFATGRRYTVIRSKEE